MHTALIVVAAGSGERLDAGIDKPYVEVDGHPLVWHCLKSLDEPDLFEQRIVTVAPGTEARFRAEILDPSPLQHPVELVAGGATRQESVCLGLQALRDEIELVAIHDGARPCIDALTVRATFSGCDGVEGALVAIPLQDALKRVRDNLVVEEVAREELWRAQTPQTFRVAAIRAAHEAAGAAGYQAADDVELVTRSGGRVRIIQGSKTNLKVTEPGDLCLAAMVLRDRRGRAGGHARIGSTGEESDRNR